MKLLFGRIAAFTGLENNKKGMEMVQVAILVAIAVAVGIIFKDGISDFVKEMFDDLNSANFSS